MENKEIVKQMVNLHKTYFENSFSMMVKIQDQAEKIMKSFIDHAPGITDEGKKVMDQLNSVYKKNRDDFKKAVDEGYAKVEEFFDSDTIVMFQDKTKKMFDVFSFPKNWMPFDFKKTMEESVAMYKKGYDEFKKQFDENIRHVGDFFPAAKPETDTKQKK